MVSSQPLSLPSLTCKDDRGTVPVADTGPSAEVEVDAEDVREEEEEEESKIAVTEARPGFFAFQLYSVTWSFLLTLRSYTKTLGEVGGVDVSL